MARALAYESSAFPGSASLSRRHSASFTQSSVRVAAGSSSPAFSSAPSRASAALAHPEFAAARRASLGESVFFRRVLGHRGLDGLLCPPPIAHAFLEHTGKVEARARAVARGRRTRHPPLVELREILALAERAVHELEGLERVVEERLLAQQGLEALAARRVVGHALERLPQGGEALGLLAVAKLEHPEPVEQIGLHLRVGLDVDAPLEHLGERAVVLEAHVETVERRQDGRVVAHPLAGRSVGARRAGRVAELLLGDLAEPHEQVGGNGGLEVRGRPLLQGVGVATPPLGAHALGEPLDFGVDLPVLRLLGQRTDERRLRALQVGELALRHARDRAQGPRPVGRLGLQARAAGASRTDARVRRGRPAERRTGSREAVRRVAAQLVVLLADAPDGRRRLLVEARREHLAVRVEGRRRVLELHRVQRRDALLQHAHSLGILRGFRLLLQVVEQLGPHLLVGVERVQALEHARVAAPDRQGLVQALDGLAPVGQILLVARRRVGQELELEGLRRRHRTARRGAGKGRARRVASPFCS